ncbi:glycerol-3-phosphate dehydrogenase, mitochondrial [Scaptodrosophila lebanonensis]|uniref:Glycerol-3-phosphate dehydrogenase n=1 Tax=Drosophila lebanonensis TaxID=7225 RepID=A0A6J2TS46_DROLE|nr:glycerol-3-phosphate dehydrogenase, mitochondrial [Scaptodrosophila lebanonensis]
MFMKVYTSIARTSIARTSIIRSSIRRSSTDSFWRNALHSGVRPLSCQKQLPSRQEHLHALTRTEFDVLIIGGGAAGCGCALDAAARGLKTALVEAADFASGYTSKSSKVIDGGPTALQNSIQSLDVAQLNLLRQAMKERAVMLKIAPHLNRPMPMLMPIYSGLNMPICWLGCKLYDMFAGSANIKGSHFLSKEATLDEFPLLRSKGLRGSVVYYDGQHDDARMCLALAITAAQQGATVVNHVEVIELIKQDGCCRSAGMRDVLTGKEFYVNSRMVINATGALTDLVRQMDDCKVQPIAAPSCTTMVSLPSYFGSPRYGLVSGNGSYNPSLVMLPWENHTLLGILNSDCEELTKEPAPTQAQVDCLLSQARKYLEENVELGNHHMRSAWMGIRPDVHWPYEHKYQKPTRPLQDYLVEVSDNNMITMAGGRWSTYRLMAAKAVDVAMECCPLEPEKPESNTSNLLLDGAHGWHGLLPVELMQCYDIQSDVAQHLADAYGSNAHHLLAESTPGSRRRLHCNFPYIEAEVQYAVRHEYACTVVDVLARRLRVAFVDAVATLHMLPRVLHIMSRMKDWSEHDQKLQLLLIQKFLCREMGLGSLVQPRSNVKRKQSVSSSEVDGPLRTPKAPRQLKTRQYSGLMAQPAYVEEPPIELPKKSVLSKSTSPSQQLSYRQRKQQLKRKRIQQQKQQHMCASNEVVLLPKKPVQQAIIRHKVCMTAKIKATPTPPSLPSPNASPTPLPTPLPTLLPPLTPSPKADSVGIKPTCRNNTTLRSQWRNLLIC